MARKKLTDNQISALTQILGVRLPTDFHIEINIRKLRKPGEEPGITERVVIRRKGKESIQQSLGKVRGGSVIDLIMKA